MDAGQLHKVARLLREVALDATADPGETPVSAGDVAIAEDITHHEKASVGEIAARTGLAQSLVSRTVAKLHDAGVVVTERDPDDGRRVLTSIAPGTRTGLFRSRARRPVEPAPPTYNTSGEKGEYGRSQDLPTWPDQDSVAKPAR